MATTKDETTDKGYTGKVGNIGGDVTLSFSANGTPWAHFQLAVDARDADGKIDNDAESTWYTVKAFHDLAEHTAECLGRGMRVVVCGKAQLRNWETDDGKAGTERIILADGVGPDLRWATAEVTKVARKAATHAKAGAGKGAAPGDEEPF